MVTQDRHSPPESGALAKAASGALETVKWVRAVNLARALEDIAEAGFWRIGLTGGADVDLKEALGPKQVALVLDGLTNRWSVCSSYGTQTLVDAVGGQSGVLGRRSIR